MIKTVILLFFNIFLFSPIVFSQNAQGKKLPEIIFERTEHNFGTIPYGSNATCEFTYKNTSKSPLILTDVRSSCGCTIPSWPKNPLHKKQKGKIIVKYNTHRMGYFHKTVTVISNAKNSPVVLTITGKVESIKNIKKPKVTNTTISPSPVKH